MIGWTQNEVRKSIITWESIMKIDQKSAQAEEMNAACLVSMEEEDELDLEDVRAFNLSHQLLYLFSKYSSVEALKLSTIVLRFRTHMLTHKVVDLHIAVHARNEETVRMLGALLA